MDYRSAFIELIDRNGLDVLNNNFLVHSLLLDKIGNSIQDKTLADAYYELNIISNIYKEITSLSFKDSIKRINGLINQSDNRYSFLSYKESINPLLFYLFPSEAVVNNLTKVEQVKVKIVRANNPKGVVINKVPPQPIIAAPVAKPQKNKQIITSCSLYLDIACKRLILKESNYKHIKVLNKDGTDITKTIYLKSKKRGDEIKLTSKRKEYTVVVPSKAYKKMNIAYSGKYLLLSNYFHQSSLKELTINCFKGDVFAYCDLDEVNIFQGDGLTNVYGRADNVKIVSNKKDVKCGLTASSVDRCEIIAKDGNIDLEFIGKKVKPKINHLFTKVSYINGVYQLGNRNVKLLLKANNGKIKAR